MTEGRQGIREDGGQVRLVEDDARVEREQACVDRQVALADSVATEQETRADLVDGRHDDRRRERVRGPPVVAIDAAP